MVLLARKQKRKLKSVANTFSIDDGLIAYVTKGVFHLERLECFRWDKDSKKLATKKTQQ